MTRSGGGVTQDKHPAAPSPLLIPAHSLPLEAGSSIHAGIITSPFGRHVLSDRCWNRTWPLHDAAARTTTSPRDTPAEKDTLFFVTATNSAAPGASSIGLVSYKNSTLSQGRRALSLSPRERGEQKEVANSEPPSDRDEDGWTTGRKNGILIEKVRKAPQSGHSTGNRQRSVKHLYEAQPVDAIDQLRWRSSGAGVAGNDMSTMSGGSIRIASSRPNRYENRAPINSVLCRNGPQCRKHLEGTCNYNHDFGSGAPNGFLNMPKKSLNVESPLFTPKPINAQPVKIGISPKAASAAAFTPRGSGSATPATASHSKEFSGDFNPQLAFQPSQQFQEFVPSHSFLASPQIDHSAQLQHQLGGFGDPFLTQQSIDAAQAQLNPFAQQAPGLGGQPFFQDASNYKHPLNYYLYASIGPRRDNLMPHQRSTADFFLPDNLREDLQQKSEATLQTFANSTLPMNVEYFHSLVALDSNNTRSITTFGYPSWIYKATSSRDGRIYALRRIEGFKLTDEACIRTINSWKRISSASIVQVHDTFTGRWFGDSSLVIVTDYHPKSQTLAEKHFSTSRNIGKASGQMTQENELWGYVVQFAMAIKTIHDASLAARTITPTKVLLTSKNRIRLGACGILDILQHGEDRDLGTLQRNDLQDLGRLILGVASRNPMAHQNTPKALEQVSRFYSERLRSCIAWLLMTPSADGAVERTSTSPSTITSEYNIAALLTRISDKILTTMDSTLHLEDELTSNLMRELENGRLVRLLAKLNVILERPEATITANTTTNPSLLNQPSSAWSETGERYYLKLFRDFVFHQVDPEGRPVLDLGHIVTCLNKLDAGIDEKIQLVSRDEQSVFITSYKEVKRGFEAAWGEISKASNPSRR